MEMEQRLCAKRFREKVKNGLLPKRPCGGHGKVNQARTISNKHSCKSCRLHQELDEIGKVEVPPTFEPRFSTDVQEQKFEVLGEFGSQYRVDHAGHSSLRGRHGPDNKDSLFHARTASVMSGPLCSFRSGSISTNSRENDFRFCSEISRATESRPAVAGEDSNTTC